MFDSISFEIENFEITEFENLIQNWILVEPKNIGGYKFQVNWQNLRINYYLNQSKIKVSNSVQKFFTSEICIGKTVKLTITFQSKLKLCG